MTWITVKQALKSPPSDDAITLKGWVRTRRDSKAGLSFIQLHDGTTFDPIQIVAKNDLPNYDDTVLHLTTGCAIEASGTLVESKGKGQAVEMQATSLTLVGAVEDPDTYPASAKRHTFEYLREVAHLRVRTNTFGAVARVRHHLATGIHRFFHDRDFYYVHTPIITANDAEGAGDMFRVSTLDAARPPLIKEGDGAGGVDFKEDFFGREAHLTVSGQLNVETYCQALSRVYTFGPTFRAENSNTTRHLAEFWMVEPEIAFADLMDDARLAEEMLKHLFDDILTHRADDMAFFDERIEPGLIERLRHIIDAPFRTLPYTDAIRILRDSGKPFDYEPVWGSDLQTEHERYLTEEHFKQPVAVINYPRKIKAFYMRLNDEGTDGAPEPTVAAMDVLVPGVGELIGGSQREERLDVLDAAITDHGLDPHDYWWYRDLRRYGTTPHAGFGLGFERLVQFCTGMQNIRDVIPFPRAPKQAEF